MHSNSLLKTTPGLYRGLVTGLESGACSARIDVRSAPGGCLTVDYEATSERHGLQHREHTIVTPEALHVAFDEAPGVSVLVMTAEGVFKGGVPGQYAMEIHASLQDGDLTWSWHWAKEGAEPRVMSRAVCRLTEF